MEGKNSFYKSFKKFIEHKFFINKVRTIFDEKSLGDLQ